MADQAMGRLRRPACRCDAKLADAIVELTANGGAWTRPDFAARWAEARRMAADWKVEATEVVKEAPPAQQARMLMLQAAKMAPARWGAKA